MGLGYVAFVAAPVMDARKKSNPDALRIESETLGQRRGTATDHSCEPTRIASAAPLREDQVCVAVERNRSCSRAIAKQAMAKLITLAEIIIGARTFSSSFIQCGPSNTHAIIAIANIGSIHGPTTPHNPAHNNARRRSRATNPCHNPTHPMEWTSISNVIIAASPNVAPGVISPLVPHQFVEVHHNASIAKVSAGRICHLIALIFPRKTSAPVIGVVSRLSKNPD